MIKLLSKTEIVVLLIKSCVFLTIYIGLNNHNHKLEGFLNRLNNFHPNLKFAHEKFKFSVNFLDLSISIVDNKLETLNLFFISADRHHFLYFNSTHSFHNKKSIVYSQGLRFKKLCSSPLTFQKHLVL